MDGIPAASRPLSPPPPPPPPPPHVLAYYWRARATDAVACWRAGTTLWRAGVTLDELRTTLAPLHGSTPSAALAHAPELWLLDDAGAPYAAAPTKGTSSMLGWTAEQLLGERRGRVAVVLTFPQPPVDDVLAARVVLAAAALLLVMASVAAFATDWGAETAADPRARATAVALYAVALFLSLSALALAALDALYGRRCADESAEAHVFERVRTGAVACCAMAYTAYGVGVLSYFASFLPFVPVVYTPQARAAVFVISFGSMTMASTVAVIAYSLRHQLRGHRRNQRPAPQPSQQPSRASGYGAVDRTASINRPEGSAASMERMPVNTAHSANSGTWDEGDFPPHEESLWARCTDQVLSWF